MKPILRLLCLVILILVLLVYCNVKEGFEDVPEYCATAGIKPPTAYIKFIFKIFGKKEDEIIPQVRGYSQSECSKLNGIFRPDLFTGGACFKLKEDVKKNDSYDFSPNNIEINYTEKCGGLNKLPNISPSECKVNDKVLGKMNKAFSATIDKKPFMLDDNTIRIYTESECKKLDGQHVPIVKMMKEKKLSDDEMNNFIKINGNGYGLCISKVHNLSVICGTEETPSATQKASSAVGDAIKSFF